MYDLKGHKNKIQDISISIFIVDFKDFNGYQLLT